MKLVVFELDDTIIDAESMGELAKAAGKEKEFSEIAAEFEAGNMKHEEAIKKTAKLLEGMNVEKAREVANSLPLMNGAAETIATLRNRGVKTVILSSSFSILAEKIKKDLSVDVIANELALSNGIITGEVVGEVVQENSKGSLLEKIAKDMKIPLRDVAAVSGRAKDAGMLKKAGLSIAFNPKASMHKTDVVIEEKDLTKILPHVFQEFNLDEMLKEMEKLELLSSEMKLDAGRKRAALKKLITERQELIKAIKAGNSEADKFKKIRDELNAKVKKHKSDREKANADIEELFAKYKKVKEEAPNLDFKKMKKEMESLEWKLQTSVMDIKKEDEIVKRIKELKSGLKGCKELIEISEKIDKSKENSRKLHENLVSASKESQQNHEKFMEAVGKIKEAEGKIAELNKKIIDARAWLNANDKRIAECSDKINELKKRADRFEVETNVRSSKMSERALRDAASSVYEKFKKGEKLDLDDIYLLRRFNLV